MPLDVDVYDRVERLQKVTDVFYAANLNNELRRDAKEVLDGLGRDGVRVDMPDERLPFDTYLKRMAQAHLVVSPRGNGEHCYRHYEALLVGSVPLINRPLRPIHYELEHAKSCLFYEPTPQGLRHEVLAALSDTDALAEIADRGESLVRTTHSKPAICQALLARAGFGGAGAEP